MTEHRIEKLTRAEAAEVLRISATTFDRIKHRKGFPRMLNGCGKRQFWLKSELIEWDISQRG